MFQVFNGYAPIQLKISSQAFKSMHPLLACAIFTLMICGAHKEPAEKDSNKKWTERKKRGGCLPDVTAAITYVMKTEEGRSRSRSSSRRKKC